ncbi:MAG: hypothetical protein SOW66_04650 [Porphyromonas sp.]|nr:hypothetical protein [Porphyromonas sp.]
MNIKIAVLALATTALLSSCDKWIDQASTPSNTLSRSEISKPNMLALVASNSLTDGPLIANTRTLIGEATAQTQLALGAMSDELTEGAVPNALLYRELSSDAVTSSSGTITTLWNKLHDLYSRSEEVLAVAQETAEAGQGSDAVRAYARYIGHLGSGLALQYLAETYSTTPSAKGGGLRLRGQIESHESLLKRAHQHYAEATAAVGDASLSGLKNFDPQLALRQLSTLDMRLYMHEGKYAEASKLLPSSLRSGEHLGIIYNSNGADNAVFSALGSDARDVQVSPALEALRKSEAERRALPLAHKVLDAKNPSVYNIYISNLTRHSTLVLVDNADVRLTTAELILRGLYTGDALSEVNALIATYDSASQLSDQPSLAEIARLRRIYLAVRGERTADLRRRLVEDEATAAFATRRVQWIPLPEREL